MLPQVLAGLGLFSLLSASCLFWLERLQPVFITLAVGALAYEGWLVHRRPRFLRTRGMLAILWGSIVINILVLGAWVVLWFRYR